MKLQFFDSAEYREGLKLGSVSTMAAAQREAVYFDAIKNLETLQDINRRLQNFDNLDATGNMAPSAMGVALAEASVKAIINSIVGFVAIERPMTQMTQNLVYRDVLTKAGASVMPMLGQDNPRNRANQSKYNTPITEGSTEYTITLEPTIAGSVAITLKLGGTTYQAMDDRKGNILSQAGLLSEGTINYATGKLDLTFAEEVPANSTIDICYAINKELGQGNNRTTIKQGYFEIKAQINKFEYEADLITAMISQKTVGGDVVAELQQATYDEQVLSINSKLVNTMRDSYVGNTMTIDLSAFSVEGGFFQSMLQVFNTGMAAVDNAIASRCFKATQATAYMVGNGIATFFQSLEDTQGWVPNTTGYVNDVIGFYKGRAVIRHLDLDDYEGFAIVKTANGQLAPLGYGILLPATNLPLVGNFANVNEVAGGIYSVDGVAPVALALAQRFVLRTPADWMVLAE